MKSQGLAWVAPTPHPHREAEKGSRLSIWADPSDEQCSPGMGVTPCLSPGPWSSGRVSYGREQPGDGSGVETTLRVLSGITGTSAKLSVSSPLQ